MRLRTSKATIEIINKLAKLVLRRMKWAEEFLKKIHWTTPFKA